MSSSGTHLGRLRPGTLKINPGNLRHPVILEKLNKTPDGAGGTVGTWVKVKDVWADIQPMGGSATWIAKVDKAIISHRVVMRYQGDLHAYGARTDELSRSLRILFGIRVFTILAVIDRGEYDELLCNEEQAQP